MTDDRQDRIRQRAHAIWESHGRPDGADREHWEQATREIDAETSAPKKKPARVAAAPKTKAPVVKAPVAKKPVAKKSLK
jgi:hypothetical protein